MKKFFQTTWLPVQLVMLCLAIQALSQEIPLDPGVKKGTLSNGFTYYIRRNTTPEKRVQLYLVNHIGSILEDEDQQGLAHFMEHMNFNGTRNFPKNQLVDYLQKAGVRFGADLNAHTGTDETVYQLPLPADDPVLLVNGLKIMRDWAQEATLDPLEIEKERGIVLEEGRLAKGAKDRMARQYYPVLLNHSRYAARLPIGLDEILLNFKPAVLRRFQQDWYRPDLQALIVVGDIDVSQMEKVITQLFSDLKVPAVKRQRVNYILPMNGRNQFMSVTDQEFTGITLEVLFKRKAPELKTLADYLQTMKRALFSRLMAARRFTEISRTNNAAYSNMNMAIQSLPGSAEMFFFDVAAKEGRLQEAFVKTWSFLEKIRRFGFTESELERVKQSYLAAVQADVNEMEKTPSVNFVNEYKAHYLSGTAAPGVAWEAQFLKSHINEISLADMAELTSYYLQESNRDILILSAEKDKGSVPDSAAVMAWIAQVSKTALHPFKDEVVSNQLLAVKPVGGKVIKRENIPEIGVTVLTLSNGLKVVLKPTDFKNDQVLFRGFSAGGTSVYSDEQFDNAFNAAPVISQFGLGDFNPMQLSQVLNGETLNVTAAIGTRNQMINGSCSAKGLERALQITYLQFTQPRKDLSLFRNIIANAKEGIKNRGADPANAFTDTINYVMGNYSYRFSPPAAQKLDKISLDQVYAIYKERFSDASGFTFVFTGSMDIESIVPLVEQYLGSLPSLYRNEKAVDLGIHLPAGQIVKKVYRGTENKATVRLVYSGNYMYSPFNNQALNALGEILQGRVFQRLRET
jgi:zinc protease